MTEPTVVTERSSFIDAAVSASASASASAPASTSTPPSTDVRIPVEVRLTVSDPFEAYRRVRTDDGDGVYLETTGGQSGWGYFAIDPIERVQVSPDAAARDEGAPSMQAIDALLDRHELVRGDCDVPYPCGAFGWLSYDIARELEDVPSTTPHLGLPRLQLGVFDRVVAWEEPRTDDETTLRITACPVVGDAPGAAYDAGVSRALSLAEAIRNGDDESVRLTPPERRATFESECGKAAFADRVAAVKSLIRDGDTFQANISHRLLAPATVEPVEAYAALRRVNPAPYSSLVEFPGIDLVSASPELLLDVDGDRLLTEPIAGTRPRGQSPSADAELEAALRSNEKERAEHAMLVDLERNDLGKVSEYGTVSVTEYRRVDRYSEVMHLVSRVAGRRRADCSLADAVAAVFPGGTITGAPKPRTMEIIDEMESTRRGPYTGSVGVFGFDDRATLNIIIRTLVRRDDEYRLRVGAGIVHDSVPALEYEETLDKARALVTAVDEALGERGTFAVDAPSDPLEGSQ